MRNIEKKMQRELKRLTRLFNLHEPQLKWMPSRARYSGGRRLSGELLGDIIYIYEEDMASALTTLQHEIIEKWVSDNLTAPYKHLVNALISAFEDDAYRRRERAIKKLCDVLGLDRDTYDDNR